MSSQDLVNEEAMHEADLPAWPYGPADYRRFAVMLSVGIHAGLYAGMIGLLWGLNDQDWILGWKPLATTLVSTAVFARLAYSWIMRLDARYGRGSGWLLRPTMVKLPELRAPSRPRGSPGGAGE